MIFSQKINCAVKTISFVLVFSIVFSNWFVYEAVAGGKVETTFLRYATLNRFTTDLTGLARANQIKSNLNFEREVASLVRILADGGLRQPVVLDETGENRELVVERLAVLLAAGDAPAALRGKRVLKLECSRLFSDDRAGNLQTIEKIFDELADSKGEVILFIDELTDFVGGAEINNPLTNLILQKKLQIIGGGSQPAYQEKIGDNDNISALFEPVVIGNQFNATVESDGDREIGSRPGFQGDNLSPDSREMMASDPTGRKSVDVIIQSKNADASVFRSQMTENKAETRFLKPRGERREK